jgi:hypothetical protein
MGQRRLWAVPVAFGRHPTRSNAEGPRGDDQRSARTRECLAECLDGAAVGVGCLLEPSRESEVVLERQVNDAVGAGGRGPQRGEVIDSAALDLSAGGGKRRGRSVRASQPEDLMARTDEVDNGGGADPAGRTSD